MDFVKETAPHLQRKDNLKWMLLNVIIALAPVFVWSFVVYPIPSLQIYPLSIATCLLCEFLFILITKKKASEFKIENILSSLITAIIYAMCLPTDIGFASGTGYFAVVAGAAIGIVLGKLVFGGLGNNIFNPAALGMLVVRVGWGGISGFASSPFITTGGSAIANGAVYSNIANANFLDLLLGNVQGSLGETFHIAILIGLVYLLVTRTIDWRVVVSYAGTFLVLMFAASIVVTTKIGLNPAMFLAYQVLSGGFLFGLVYMITDPVTSPAGSPARFIYGAFGAAIAVMIRLFMGTEGVGFSILFANIIACVLDYPGWASARWKKWHIIALPCIVVLSLVAVVLVLLFKEGAIA